MLVSRGPNFRKGNSGASSGQDGDEQDNRQKSEVVNQLARESVIFL